MGFDETFPEQVIKIASLLRDRIDRLQSDRTEMHTILELMEGDARALEDLARWVIEERTEKPRNTRRT